MLHRILCGLAISGLLACVPASATVLYSNGADGGMQAWCISAGCPTAGVNTSFSVLNSFTLSSPAALGSVDFALWVMPGDSTNLVDWVVASDIKGNILYGTGSSAPNFLAYELPGGLQNTDGLVQENVSISTPTSTLPAGTYYLTLSNAQQQNGGPAYWGQSDGPSTGYSSGNTGALNGCCTSNLPSSSTDGTTLVTGGGSESFTVLDTTVSGLQSGGSTGDNGGNGGNGTNTFSLTNDAKLGPVGPEPLTAALMGSGLLLIAGIARRRARR